jgi:hypothetical protein
MRKVQTKIFVSKDGTGILRESHLSPGEHDITYWVNENIDPAPKPGLRWSIPVFHAQLIDPDNRFRREDMYEDDGR